jgi:hypothetical protein
MRPAKDVDGADVMDYFLLEEEDLSRVDKVLQDPLSEEREAEFVSFDEAEGDEEELNSRIPVSNYELKRLKLSAEGRRMSTMSVYARTRSPATKQTSRKKSCSPSSKAGRMRKMVLARAQPRRREREGTLLPSAQKFCYARLEPR